MTEPDVTLTDYALTVECALFAVLLLRSPSSRLRNLFALLFASLGVAALLGGTVHGFFLREDTFGYQLLWRKTLAAIGLVALASWMIGAELLFRERIRSWLSRLAAVEFFLYCLVVVFVTQQFWVAIVNYLPPTLLLLVAFVQVHRRSGEFRLRYAIAGMLLTFAAAAVQQLEIAVHPIYFNHNALYHAIQAVALLLIFVGIRPLLSS